VVGWGGGDNVSSRGGGKKGLFPLYVSGSDVWLVGVGVTTSLAGVGARKAHSHCT
jgi:hypothetical protein